VLKAKNDNEVPGEDIARSGPIRDIVLKATGVDLSTVDAEKIEATLTERKHGEAYVSIHVTDEQLFVNLWDIKQLKFKPWQEALKMADMKYPKGGGQGSPDIRWFCVTFRPLHKVAQRRCDMEFVETEGSFLRPINPKKGQPLLLCVGCGGGKSTQIRQWITKQDTLSEPKLKILFLSVRRSHSHDAENELKEYGWLKEIHGFRSYLDEDSPICAELSENDKELERKRRCESFNRFIVSIESFY
jgi:hypothetical protein